MREKFRFENLEIMRKIIDEEDQERFLENLDKLYRKITNFKKALFR